MLEWEREEIHCQTFLMKLKGKSFNMAIIVVYIHTSENTKNEIQKFYNTPEIAKYQSKSQGIIIMVQAKEGRKQDSEMIVKYGLGSCNKCRKNWLIGMYSNKFENCVKHLSTWHKTLKSQIDYLPSTWFRNAVLHSKVYPNTDCNCFMLNKGKL